MNSTYVYIEDSGNLYNTKILIIAFIVLQNKNVFQGAKIFIDGDTTLNKNPLLLYKIKKVLKLQNVTIKSIRFENSKSNNLIQLADMCGGCIRKNFERGTVLDKEMFQLLQKFVA